MSKVTPLHELETEAGANFEPFGGWEAAARFGDPLAEYDALRYGTAVVDLSFLGKLRAAGKDRLRYLNSMLTNDVRKLGPGSGCYAALLTRQGHMESDLWIYAFADEYWLECPPGTTARVLATLQKHIVSDKVDLEDFTDRYGVLSLQGTQSAQIMERTVETSLTMLRPFDHLTISGREGSRIVVRQDRTGRAGYDLWLPRAALQEVWRRLVESERVRPAGITALNWIRTEAGIPWYGIDMDDRTLPMEVGLESAISMTKGCYRGQEIVARVTHRGHLDRGLGGIVIEATELPAKGAEVRSQGTKIGEVTSAIRSPRLGRPLALAVLKKTFLEPATPLEVDCGGVFRSGSVVSLPLPQDA